MSTLLDAEALSEHLPRIFSLRLWALEVWQWLALAAAMALAPPLGALLQNLTLRLGGRLVKLTASRWDDDLLAAARGPLRWLIAAGLLGIGTRAIQLPEPAQHAADVALRMLSIAALTAFGLRALHLLASYAEKRLTNGEADVGSVRGIQTQITVLRRVLDVTLIVVSVAIALMQFQVVRSVGVSLLASAGIAGLVLGLAAQKSISTLLAGIQLSITQPIRIGDTVIVENEWGWIEEVTLTYVVVKVWDLRRLVVPMTYFLERPFQNWSKVSPELLGTVEVRADYTCDVDAVRAELRRIVETEGKHLWDGKAQGIQVTDCSERTITLRALVSAATAGNQWDLRCLVRERLVAFLRRTPEWLPHARSDTHVIALAPAEEPMRASVQSRPRNEVQPRAER